MAIVFKNNASTTLSAALSSSATSITVADATKLPSITGDEYFFCSIDDGSNIEIVKVTGVSSNTLTIVRAQDNTTAQTFSSGDIIEQRLTAAVLETFPQLDADEITATEFIGDLRGAVIFNAQAGEAIDKGEVVYVSGISGNTPIVSLADADDSSKMPAFGLALESASLNSSLAIVTFGTISGVDTSAFSVGDTLYISTTAGGLTNSKPTGEGSLIQNIGKVQRSHASAGSIKVGGAGRTNDTPNLNDGNIFIGNASNQATTSTLDTSVVPENTNLYYTDARAQAVSINNVVEDTTPQLGGDLASNGNDILFADGDQAMFGLGNDLRIFHNGTASKIQNYTGHFDIQNLADGQDIRFGSDDGAGGVANYFRIDGGDQISVASKNIRFEDSVKSTFGNSDDLEIYHDGNNSFIRDNGDGDLFIEASNNHYLRFINGEYAIVTAENAGVGLRYNNVEKIVTTDDGALIKEGLTVGSSANDLGTTAGNQLTPLTLRSDTSNTDSLLFTTERLSNGTDWTTAAHRIQRKVDVTKMGYIQFGSNSTDLITFGKNTSEYGRFSGSGDFGVGESNPLYKLHITGGAGDGIYVDGTQNTSIFLDSNNNTTGPFTIRVNSDEFHIKNQSTSGFNTGGSFLKYTDGGSLQFLGDGLVVTSSDEVAIGHTDPDTKLHIKGGGVNGGIFVEDSSSSSVSPVIKVQGNRQDTNESQSFTGGLALSSLQTNALANDGKHIGTIYFGTNHTDGTAANIAYSASIAARLSGAANSATDMPTDLVFYTGSTGRALGTSNQTYGDEALRITADGNFSIGTDAASGRLHVNKDGTGQIIALFSSDMGTNNRNFSIRSPASDSASAPFEFSTGNSFQFTIDGGAALNIASDKSVGIGTISPDTIMEIVGADPVLTIRDTETGVASANSTLRLAESGGSDTLGSHFDVGLGNNQILAFGFSADGSTATEQMRLEGQTGNFGIGTSSLNGKLHIGSANATGNATNPALQIGGTTTYRLGLYTAAERGVIDCPNGDDGLDFRVKTAGLAMRVLGGTGGVRVVGTSALGTGTVTANNVEIGVTSGTTNTGIKFDTASTAVSGDNRVYLIENKSGDRLRFMTAAGTEILSMLHEGRVGINVTNPAATIDVDGTIKLDGNYPTGTDNVALGNQALDDPSLSGSNNIAIGSSALTANTTGGFNTALGSVSLRDNVTGSNLTGVGYGALVLNTASNNTGVGYKALHLNTSGGENTAVGKESLLSNTTGASNTAVGSNALLTSTTAGNNTAVGFNSMTSTTTGGSNTALGGNSLPNNTTGSNNTALGRYAMQLNTTGIYNTAVGWIALGANTTGNSNTAVGMYSLRANTASENTALGYKAMYLNTTGLYNVAVGVNALDANTTANRGTAIGYLSLSANTTGAENTAVGYYSLVLNTTGNRNVAVGDGALDANTTASDNTAVGQGALGGNTTGTRNTAMGQLAANDTTTGNDLVAMGQNALALNTTGSKNTAIGRAALEANTTANNNTAVGYHALLDNVTGTQNTAVGSFSLANSTATGNTAFGFNSGRFTTTGVENTALGRYSLYDNTTGSFNVAVGNLALQTGTAISNCVAVGTEAQRYATGTRNVSLGNETLRSCTGDDNTAIGHYSMDAASCSGSDNTAVGSHALGKNTTGYNDVAIGTNALTNNTTGQFNTAVGVYALGACVGGQQNVGVGYYSLPVMTTALYNTAIGLQSGRDCTTGSDNVFLGYRAGDGPSPSGSITTQSNRIVIGNNSSTHAYIRVSWTVTSDKRDKADIEPLKMGLDLVNKLEPVTYKWDMRSDYEDGKPDGTHKKEKLNGGLLAQDVEKLERECGYKIEDNTSILTDKNADGNYGLQYEKFVPVLINAVQELSSQVDELKQELKTLKGE